VDASSGKVFVCHQVSLASGETIQAMHAIVQDACENGICIHLVHTDNAPFNASEFCNYIAHELGATQTFSSVRAHHQPSIAERAIGTITSWARTMMLHSIIHWPDSANLELWLFAMDHTVYSLPRKATFLSPNELYTRIHNVYYTHLQCSNVWGCPVYVLDSKLQDGKKIPKWKMHARRSYLGQSPSHSLLVGLVLSLKTGHVSPQWHCVFDNLFSTVVSPCRLTNTFDADEWQRLVFTSLECYNHENYDDNNIHLAPLSLAPEWHPNDDDNSLVVSCVFPSPPSPKLGQTLPAEPPHCTLSDVVKDIVKDMLPTSQTEGAGEVIVNPPMPAPEGEVLDTIDNMWDQALVDDDA
jgi:hypothetical protein